MRYPSPFSVALFLLEYVSSIFRDYIRVIMIRKIVWYWFVQSCTDTRSSTASWNTRHDWLRFTPVLVVMWMFAVFVGYIFPFDISVGWDGCAEFILLEFVGMKLSIEGWASELRLNLLDESYSCFHPLPVRLSEIVSSQHCSRLDPRVCRCFL